MAGKKKKSGSAKKNKTCKPRLPPPDVESVLARADEAVNASDIQTALSLYTFAASQIRERIDGSNDSTEVASEESVRGCDAKYHADILLLSKTLGKCGEARVALGDQEGGREAFLDAIALLGGGSRNGSEYEDLPSENESARGCLANAQLREAKSGLLLYLGQLCEGEEALSHYRLGVAELQRCVEILETLLSAEAVDEDRTGGIEEEKETKTLQMALLETRSQLCGAHCSIAELYLTDLCYDPGAEKLCEASLQAALGMDDAEGTPDALQGMANLRLSQGRGAEATRLILEAYSRMRVGCEAMADLVGLGKEATEETENTGDNGKRRAKELVEVDAANSLPGYEFRCQTAKLLLECSAVCKGSVGKIDACEDLSKKSRQGLFCAEAAVQVLGSLLAENDEVVEVWYLLGCAFASFTPTKDDVSRYYWERAHEMLITVKKSINKEIAASKAARDDESMNNQIREIEGQIEEVEEKLAGLDNKHDQCSSANDDSMEIS